MRIFRASASAATVGEPCCLSRDILLEAMMGAGGMQIKTDWWKSCICRPRGAAPFLGSPCTPGDRLPFGPMFLGPVRSRLPQRQRVLPKPSFVNTHLEAAAPLQMRKPSLMSK